MSDTTSGLLTLAQNSPNPNPIGEPFTSEAGWTCFNDIATAGVTPGANQNLPVVTHSTNHLCSTITLTDLQIRALHTTPVQVLPAPPTGYAIKVDSAILNFIAGSVAYSGTGAHNITLNSAGTGTTLLSQLADGILNNGTVGQNYIGVFTDEQNAIVDTLTTHLLAQAVNITAGVAYTLGTGIATLIIEWHYVPLS